MKKILIPIAVLVLGSMLGQSCRMAPKDNPGDTVSAKYFEPPVPVVQPADTVTDSIAADSLLEDSTLATGN